MKAVLRHAGLAMYEANDLIPLPMMSGGRNGEQRGPQISEPYEAAGRTKASNVMGKDFSHMSLSTLPAAVHMDTALCQSACVAYGMLSELWFQEQAMVLERGRLQRDLAANLPKCWQCLGYCDFNLRIPSRRGS